MKKSSFRNEEKKTLEIHSKGLGHITKKKKKIYKKTTESHTKFID